MLTIVTTDDLWNEETEEFESLERHVLEFEHSLISLSKWESKYQKPFLGDGSKTSEETFDYLKMMLLTPNVSDEMLVKLSPENIIDINQYISSTQSATTFGELPKTRVRNEVITSELIYYWMIVYTIPFSCELWHLNRLFSLIRICNIKQSKQKKMTRSEIAQRNNALNAKRKAELGTTG